MIILDDQQQAAKTWFESLRDRICAAVNVGFCASTSAAIPETNGAEADVP